jgi:transposase
LPPSPTWTGRRAAGAHQGQAAGALPRIGEVNLAQVVAEVGPILDRAGDVEQASAECGATPVTRASDKTKAVAFRWAANAKARQALTTFASNSRHRSPWAAKLYAHAPRRRGKHHPHAVPILARAWLRVIWAGWHTNTVYDPPSTAPRNASPPEPDSGELKRTSPG